MTFLRVKGLDSLEKAFKKDFKSYKAEYGYGQNSGNHPSGRISYADIAYTSEWGGYVNVYGNDGKIPKRPFFTAAVKNVEINMSMIRKVMLQKGVFNGKKVIQAICDDLRRSIKKEINDWSFPANARLTVRKKGFNNPLVETGGLYKAAKLQGEIESEEV